MLCFCLFSWLLPAGSAETIVHASSLRQRMGIIKLAVLPSHCVLTLDQPVQALVLLTLNVLYNTIPHTLCGFELKYNARLTILRLNAFCGSRHCFLSSVYNQKCFGYLTLENKFSHFLFIPYRSGFGSSQLSPFTPGC